MGAEINDKNTLEDYIENDITEEQFIDKIDKELPSIYAGSEDKMLNLVVEIIVKIIIKEVL
ncbi:hypothetical protein EZ428_09305 [Pedobacter frigiditerrae]|uniref:Uncharacterized protein n=1 Tax=Pedobacter frigiditerrae TaxID=2530452 RepID=A0A4R0N0Y1_9SPHI|nr:hypothetical protein [Pedobacter frigiditerrae]TCC91934.1 hypothetical protein EZ428_09305 [Pedobacter frigiditerrae]